MSLPVLIWISISSIVVFISQYCWTCKSGVVSCNSSTSFISCTSHCVTGKSLEKQLMLLHYPNTAVSECMHLQHEEFVPHTFFFYSLINLCAYTWSSWLLCSKTCSLYFIHPPQKLCPQFNLSLPCTKRVELHQYFYIPIAYGPYPWRFMNFIYLQKLLHEVLPH